MERIWLIILLDTFRQENGSKARYISLYIKNEHNPAAQGGGPQ